MSDFVADPVTEAIAALVGIGPDSASVDRIARLARFLLDEPTLNMRLGPYRLDAASAATKAAVTAAVLAVAIESAGLDSVPVVVLASILPFIVEIERVELAPGDELVATALRATAPSGGDHEWYHALPPELRAQLTQIEFINLLGRLRDAGLITTGQSGDHQFASTMSCDNDVCFAWLPDLR